MNLMISNQAQASSGDDNRSAVLEKITDGLFVIKDNISMAIDQGDVEKLTQSLMVTETSVGLPRLVRWIESNAPKYAFLGVHYLRSNVFSKDPILQEALQFAIDTNILEIYTVQNKDTSKPPVSAVRLNRKNENVIKMLDTSRDKTQNP